LSKSDIGAGGGELEETAVEGDNACCKERRSSGEAALKISKIDFKLTDGAGVEAVLSSFFWDILIKKIDQQKKLAGR